MLERHAPCFNKVEGRRIKRRDGRVLSRCRRRQEEVLRQFFNGPTVTFGHHKPAQAPASHLEILREALHDPDVITALQCGGRGMVVGQSLIDLIEDEMPALLADEIGEGAYLIQAEHGACRVGGRRKQRTAR
ncbi:hypothetical protein D3C86_1587990 [compost metagenome]